MAQQKHQLFELLKQDHRQAEQMMEEIESASEDTRQEVFFNLKAALQEHMQLEEKHFYPPLQKIAEMKEMVQDALDEHQETKDYLSQLEEIDFDSDDWIETFDSMQEGIQHHVQDEEKKIFPKCAQLLNQEQLDKIGEKCAQEKQKAQPARKAQGGRGKSPTRKQPQL